MPRRPSQSRPPQEGRPPSGELPWTPSETEQLHVHADVIQALRAKVEGGTATNEEGKRFAEAVFALQKALEEKRRSVEHGPLLQEARDILGADNVLGPEAVKATWDRDLAPHEIPPIPYTREQLEGAISMNMMLVLHINRDAQGNPLTGKRMNEIVQPKLTAAKKGKLLFKVDWYATEPFYTTAVSKPEWTLVTRDLLPNSTALDYADQTKLLRETLSAQLGLTQAEKDAIAQADDATLARLKQDASSDDVAICKPVAQALAALKVNQNHRRSLPDVFFDHATLLETQNTRLFNGQALHDWTNDQSSFGSLVGVGSADSGGVHVTGLLPKTRYGPMGVSFSR